MGCNNVVVTFQRPGRKPHQFVVRPGSSLHLGRGQDCDICFSSTDVSNRHFEIVVEAPQSKVPSFLKVVAPNGPDFIAGTYAVVAGELRNGYPLWRKIGDSYWIYSTMGKKWAFGGLSEHRVSFKCDSAYVFCSFAHEGKMPSSMRAAWQRNNQEGAMWTADAQLAVTDLNPSIPPLLRVDAPNGPKSVAGVYALVEETRPNGYPLWKKTDAELWLFSLITQRWGIGGIGARKINFETDSGACIFSSMVHNGKMPHSVGRSWKRSDLQCTEDSQIIVKSTTFGGNAELASTSVDSQMFTDSVKCFVRDTSSNGTGVKAATDKAWRRLGKGMREEILGETMFLVPFHAKRGSSCIEFHVKVLEDSVPDPHDVRIGCGRWKYGNRLGEGALGVVYRAFDATACICKPRADLQSENDYTCQCFGTDVHGGVALKILKEYQRDRGKQLRRAYILHREAQWSMQVLHNPNCRGFCQRRAAIFAQYYEDHTGACSWTNARPDWQKECGLYEAPDFKWAEFNPSDQVCEMPYVVMEYVPGNNVHVLLGFTNKHASSDLLLSKIEKLCLLTQATEALDYLTNFDLIHRDFRTTNLLWAGRGASGRLVVIDLGLMLFADEANIKNKSPVVRVNWRGTEKNPFEWAPNEVRIGARVENFVLPPYSFDIFSLAALAIQLETANVKFSREAIAAFSNGAPVDGKLGVSIRQAVGLDASVLKRMLGHASQRPQPRQVLLQLQRAHLASQAANLKQISKPSRRRSRSRSRTRSRHERSSHSLNL